LKGNGALAYAALPPKHVLRTEVTYSKIVTPAGIIKVRSLIAALDVNRLHPAAPRALESPARF